MSFIVNNVLAADLVLSDVLISASKILNSISSGMKKLQDKQSGPRLNIKTVLSTCGDFDVKDKTAIRTSYL